MWNNQIKYPCSSLTVYRSSYMYMRISSFVCKLRLCCLKISIFPVNILVFQDRMWKLFCTLTCNSCFTAVNNLQTEGTLIRGGIKISVQMYFPNQRSSSLLVFRLKTGFRYFRFIFQTPGPHLCFILLKKMKVMNAGGVYQWSHKNILESLTLSSTCLCGF